MSRPLSLAFALVAAPLLVRAEPLVLDVAPGDTPAGLLIRHARQLPGASTTPSPRLLAYRLLFRSPQVRDAVLHAGDRLVVEESGALRLEKRGAAPVPPPPTTAESAPQTPSAPAPDAAPAEVPPPAPVQVAAPAPPPRIQVSDDGRSLLRPDGTRVQIASGMTAFERAGVLHLVGTEGTAFDLAIPLADPARFVLPPNPYAALSADGGLVLPAGVPIDPGPLVTRGELHVHQDHLHLTSQFPHPAWRKLYDARAEESSYEPARKQVAAALLVKLLDRHIDMDAARFPLSLVQTEKAIDRVWQGFQQGVSARELVDGIDLDLWVAPDGSSVEIAGDRYLAAPPLRFEQCVGHFHVVGTDDAHRFAAKVPVAKDAPTSFPESPFYALAGNVLLPKPPMAAWMQLLRDGALMLRRGHYHLTPKWTDPSIAALARWGEQSPTREVREEATRSLMQLLSTPLDPKSEADLLAQLDQFSTAARAQVEALRQAAEAKGWVLERPAVSGTAPAQP